MGYNRRVLNFDMDGTIANLYKMENWLENLEKEKLDFYLAKPIFNDNFISKIIELKKKGFSFDFTLPDRGRYLKSRWPGILSWSF